MRFAASDILNVRAGELRSTYILNGGYPDTIIYDAVPGGAGYSLRLFKETSVNDLLKSATCLLDCKNECATACRNCLCDYSNQRMWDTFDRKPVLDWLQSISAIRADEHNLNTWENPSYRILSEKIGNSGEIHLIGHSLTGSGNTHNNHVLQWILEKLNDGIIVYCHLFKPLNPKPDKISISQRTVYNYLRPYIEESRLVLSHLPIQNDDVKCPRIFTLVNKGNTLWLTAYPVSPILENLMPEPMFQVRIDEKWEDRLKRIIKRSKPYPSDILSGQSELEKWELPPNQPRNMAQYFHRLKDEWIDIITIRDPWCGAGNIQIDKLRQFIEDIDKISSKIKTITIICKEQNIRDARYQRPSEMKAAIEKALSHIGSEIKVKVRLFRMAKDFHDRTVTVKTVDQSGVESNHIYDLTGGIDKLMTPESGTKIFYYKE
jgi:hypothetical protein